MQVLVLNSQVVKIVNFWKKCITDRKQLCFLQKLTCLAYTMIQNKWKPNKSYLKFYKSKITSPIIPGTCLLPEQRKKSRKNSQTLNVLPIKKKECIKKGCFKKKEKFSIEKKCLAFKRRKKFSISKKKIQHLNID